MTYNVDIAGMGGLALQLSRVPEANKKYLRDPDRAILCRVAFETFATLTRTQLTTLAQLASSYLKQSTSKVTSGGELTGAVPQVRNPMQAWQEVQSRSAALRREVFKTLERFTKVGAMPEEVSRLAAELRAMGH